MPQIIRTKNYGLLNFERTWAVHGRHHIGRLVNGAYAHIGGLPVTERQDLLDTIPAGKDLDQALDWFDNKDKRAADAALAPTRFIFYHPADGSWRYVDNGQPVDQVEALYESLKGSPFLDAAVKWFVTHQEAQRGPQAPPVPEEINYPMDQRVLALLGEAEGDGMSTHEVANMTGVLPQNIVIVLNAMTKEKRIASYNKRWYLPQFAPGVVPMVAEASVLE